MSHLSRPRRHRWRLTVREAAVLLGRSPRTVRSQVASGELRGTKVGGRWKLSRRHLPLDGRRRRLLQRKADAMRRAVDQALPSRVARLESPRGQGPGVKAPWGPWTRPHQSALLS